MLKKELVDGLLSLVEKAFNKPVNLRPESLASQAGLGQNFTGVQFCRLQKR